MIECPNCKKKIKINTKKCPYCNYNIKNYYENKKNEYSHNPTLANAYKRIGIPFIPQKINEITKILFACFLIATLFLIVIASLTPNLYILFDKLFFLIVIWGFFFIFFIFSYNSDIREHEEALEAFELYQKDPKYYKTIRIEQDVKRNKKEAFLASQKPTITCPYCKSTNVKKITTANRIAGAAVMGLASSNIGNQWYCNNCKSKF